MMVIITGYILCLRAGLIRVNVTRPEVVLSFILLDDDRTSLSR
jgi:hypothetical protein